MPYIPKERRKKILDGDSPQNAGELNFKLFMSMLDFRNMRGESYETYNRIGAAYRGVARTYTHPAPDSSLRHELEEELEAIIFNYIHYHPCLSDAEARRDVDGVLANCYLEFYRRYIAPYEDKAILRNGDI
jgi:hypothetical protein